MAASQNAGCLGVIVRLVFGISTKSLQPEAIPYRAKKYLLTGNEVAFYHVLNKVVAGRAAICPKVRLMDVIYVEDNLKRHTNIHQFISKHIDFLLCDPRSMSPLLAIEVDAASHQKQAHKKRDAFVDRVFQAAQLPILYIEAQSDYSGEALATQLDPYLSQVEIP